MAKETLPLHNRIKEFREARGWSQQELAKRTGLSRTGISAIEMGKLIPSTLAALTLAQTFGCTLEEIFQLGAQQVVRWAWPPEGEPCRYWRATVGGRLLMYPTEISQLGLQPQDGVYRDGHFYDSPFVDPAKTLVLAGCDPAVGLLAAEYAQATPYRLLAISRSSRKALDLLRDGLVHAAGMHLTESHSPEKNAEIAGEILKAPFRLLRIANWQEGLVLSSGLAYKTIREVVGAKLRWIGREPGSGARQVLDKVLKGGPSPPFMAKDHQGVVEAIRSGWADAGVSVRLVAEASGQRFISVREEAYDLCILESAMDDPRVRALVEVIRSRSLRSRVGELPGYDVTDMGELTKRPDGTAKRLSQKESRTPHKNMA